MISICSWNKPIEFNLSDIIKDPYKNELTIILDVFPLSILSLDDLNLSSIIKTDLPLTDMTYVIENGQLKLTYKFNETVQGKNGSILFDPSGDPRFFATPPKNFSLILNPSNIPAVLL